MFQNNFPFPKFYAQEMQNLVIYGRSEIIIHIPQGSHQRPTALEAFGFPPLLHLFRLSMVPLALTFLPQIQSFDQIPYCALVIATGDNLADVSNLTGAGLWAGSNIRRL